MRAPFLNVLCKCNSFLLSVQSTNKNGRQYHHITREEAGVDYHSLQRQMGIQLIHAAINSLSEIESHI